MDLGELERRLREVVPGARVPPRRPGDDLYGFRFAGQAFVPPFMDALVRLTVDAGAGTEAGREDPERRLRALAGLLEAAFAGDDEELIDGLAMRLIWSRLLRRPRLLEVAWPHLGPATRRVVGRFQALEAGCAAREAALPGHPVRARAAAPPG